MIVFDIVAYIFNAYLVILIVRAILSWVRAFNPMWYPENSIVQFLIRFMYAVTDPPLKFLSRFIPPLRLGVVALDLSFLVLFLAVMVLERITLQLMLMIMLRIY